MWLDSKALTCISFLLLTLCLGSQAQNESCNKIEARLKAGNILGLESEIKNAQEQCPGLVGQVYLRQGDNDSASKYFNNMLSNAAQNSPERAEALNSLGIVYWNAGSTNKAVDHIQQALQLRKSIFGENHETTAASYNDLGLVISNSDPDKALDYYESALNIYKELYGLKNEKTAQAQINTGIVYRQLEYFGDATVQFEEALKTWKSIYPNGHPNEGFILTNIGRTKQIMGDLEGALIKYEEALNIYKAYYDDKHPEIASSLNLIGNIYNAKGEFEKALNYYQRAIIANTNQFKNIDLVTNPAVSEYINPNILLNSLYYKSKAFADLHFNKTLKFNDLKLSLSTLQSCDSLIDIIRKVRTNEEDKLALGQIANTVYETGVELCNAMGDVVVKKEDYYALSFYFSEKSKSAVLLEAISDSKAKSFARLDESDLKREMEYKTVISYLENLSIKTEEPELKHQLQAQLIEEKAHYDDFIKSLESKYPEYYDLKYNNTLPTIEELQKQLGDNQMILSYFLTDVSKRVYIYEITKDKFKLHNNPQTDDFNKYISGLRNSMFFRVKDVYTSTATDLHNILIPKRIDKDIANLIIIPAGSLGTIPFESLLTDKLKDNTPYKQYPFLVKDYNISYSYSSALIHSNEISPNSNMALLCAPVKFEYLSELPGTEKELHAIDGILSAKGIKSNIRIDSQASEDYIKENDLQSYKYIHLATHGVVDEDNPDLSRIFLNGDNEDGDLYTGEIYNLKFDSELVTLSACETGLGKLTKGEGVIGLSRSLLYAGADNVIVSLWKVSDESTAELMTSFYSENESNGFSSPLQTSKMQLINSDKYSEPYFWAPFILIGK